jgi:hypothetical protein
MANLNNDPNVEKKVVEAVGKRTPEAQNVRILSIQKRFLNGSLYTVTFDGSANPETGAPLSYINRVYVHGRNMDVFGHDEALLNIVGATHTKNFSSLFSDTKTVSGIIAIIMTSIVVLIVTIGLINKSGLSVPEPVATAWLIIVGFYFGKIGNPGE